MFHPGDHAPAFHAPSHTGKHFYLSNEVGAPMLLLLHDSETFPSSAALLLAFEKAWPEFVEAGINLASITPDNVEDRKAFADQHHIPFPLLSDPDHFVRGYYELDELQSLAGEGSSFPNTLIILDRNMVIHDICAPFQAEFIPELLDALKARFPKQQAVIVQDLYTPPVLLIPHIFDRAYCREIMNLWETQGNQISHVMRPDGEKTYGVVDRQVKIRRDHFIRDENIKTAINGIFQRRVYPEIEKCFHYVVDEYEHFKIACYDAETGGYFRPHRDNTSGGTAHRKWALSINLNSEDYEGGYLRFPEYGPQLYKPGTGCGVVFSCSLMHEATDITAGRRFVLLSFFYGEKDSEDRLRYRETYGTENYVPKEVTESDTSLKHI